MHALTFLSSLGVGRIIIRLGLGLGKEKKDEKVETLPFFWPKKCQEIKKE
jgi:hypothetical protein